MSIHLTKRLTHVALLAGFMLPAAALLAQPSYAAPPVPPAAAMQAAPVAQAPVADTDEETIANFKDVLAKYGNFVQLAQLWRSLGADGDAGRLASLSAVPLDLCQGCRLVFPRRHALGRHRAPLRALVA